MKVGLRKTVAGIPHCKSRRRIEDEMTISSLVSLKVRERVEEEKETTHCSHSSCVEVGDLSDSADEVLVDGDHLGEGRGSEDEEEGKEEEGRQHRREVSGWSKRGCCCR